MKRPAWMHDMDVVTYYEMWVDQGMVRLPRFVENVYTAVAMFAVTLPVALYGLAAVGVSALWRRVMR